MLLLLDWFQARIAYSPKSDWSVHYFSIYLAIYSLLRSIALSRIANSPWHCVAMKVVRVRGYVMVGRTLVFKRIHACPVGMPSTLHKPWEKFITLVLHSINCVS